MAVVAVWMLRGNPDDDTSVAPAAVGSTGDDFYARRGYLGAGETAVERELVHQEVSE